jgi:hypothetical protein
MLPSSVPLIGSGVQVVLQRPLGARKHGRNFLSLHNRYMKNEAFCSKVSRMHDRIWCTGRPRKLLTNEKNISEAKISQTAIGRWALQ